MKMNTGVRVMLLLFVWMLTAHGQALPPQLASADVLARVTSNSLVLQRPSCVFDSSCSTCEIWLVASRSSVTSNFDALVNSSSLFNLSASPYPTAFNPSAPQFFLTRVGPNLCNQFSSFPYFIVGAEGVCTGTNCNGVLPDGSTVSFKYFLYEPINQTVQNLTTWTGPINLITIQSYQGINDGLSARSGAMVVITTLLSVAAALLLLLFFIMLCVSCCTNKDGGRGTVMNSIRIPRYDTHNLKEHVHPYDNPAYETDQHKASALKH